MKSSLISIVFCALLTTSGVLSATTRISLNSKFWLDYEFPDDTTIKITMSAKALGYVSIGLGSTDMYGCDMVVGRLSGSTPIAEDYYSQNHNTPSKDSVQDVTAVAGSRTVDTTSITFTRKLNTGDGSDYVIVPNQSMSLCWAYGSSDSFFEHTKFGSSTVTFTKSTTIVCHSTCLTCSGSASNQCLTCTSDKTFVSGSCITCDPSCATCSGTLSTQCLSCASGKQLVSGSCITCSSSCLTCSGPASNQCATCSADKTFVSGSCITCDPSCVTCSGSLPTQCLTCPSGKQLVSGSCITCSSTCLTCSGSASNQCLTCSAEKTLISGSCIVCDPSCQKCSGPANNQCTECSTGKFLNANSCLSCHPSCLNCSGSASNQCTECSAGKSVISGSCIVCDPSCLKCSGSAVNQCTECSAGKFLDSGYCKACDPSCLTCSGPQANQCSSCSSTKSLVNGACITCDPTCVTCKGTQANQCETCPAGKLLISGACIICDASCSTCTGPNANQCASCFDSYYLSSGSCKKCDPACKTCTGEGPSKCLSCATNYVLTGTQCAENLCDVSCLTCSGKASNQCLTCGPGRIFSEGYCLFNDVQLPANYAIMKEAEFTFYWEFVQDHVTIALKTKNEGWFSIGFGKDMNDSDMIVVEIKQDGSVALTDRYSSGRSTPQLDDTLGGKNDLALLGFTGFTNNERIVKFSRKQQTGDSFDKPLIPNSNLIVLAARTKSKMVEDHGPLFWTYTVNFVAGSQGDALLSQGDDDDDEEEEENNNNNNNNNNTNTTDTNITINTTGPIQIELEANKVWLEYFFPSNDTITIKMTSRSFGYLSIGFAPTMKNCDMVTGRMISGVAKVFDMWSTSHDTPVVDKINDLINTTGARTSENTSFTFSRKLKTSDTTQDTEILINKAMSLNWAYGTTDDFVDHGRSYGWKTITFLKAANIACHSSCLTCSGAAANQCLTCSAGKTLINGTCLTVMTNCDSSCKTCIGATAKDCLTCDSTRVFYFGQCLGNDISLPANYAIMPAAGLTFYWEFVGDYVVMALKSKGRGWFSIGFGTSMKSCDMIVVEITDSDGIIFSDRYSDSYDAPANDTQIGGASDYQVLGTGYQSGRILGTTGNQGAERIVKFKRKQITGDKYDKQLTPTSSMDVIAALTNSKIMVDHKDEYWFYAINFVEGSKGEAAEQSKDIKKIVKAHTLINLIGWGFLADVGIFFAKNLRHKNYYLLVHLICFIFVDFGSVIIGLVMLAKFSNRINEMTLETEIFKAHIGIGIMSLIMTFVQHVGGIVLKHKYIEGPNGNPNLYIFKFTHLLSGYFLLILGKINILVGYRLTEEKKDFTIFLIIFIIELLIHIASHLVYDRQPKLLTRPPPKTQNYIADMDLFMTMLKDNRPTEEIKTAFPRLKWVIFKNDCYDLSNYVHPGGNFLINPLIGKEVGRYLYGSFGLEGQKMKPYTHSPYAINLLERRVCCSEHFNCKPKSVFCASWDKVTGRTWKISSKVNLAHNITLFCFQSDHTTIKNFLPGVFWIGRHFTIKASSGNPKTRIYTSAMCFTKENRAYVKYLMSGYDSIMEEKDAEVLDKSKIPGESEFLPLIIKKYDFPDGFSNFIHGAPLHTQFEIEGPIGRGMELNPKMNGTHYLIAGGTGILPFLDFLDYLLRKAIFTALQTKKFTLVNLFNEDYINTFAKSFKVVLFGSFTNLEEFVGFKTVKKLYDISKAHNLNLFDMVLRFSNNVEVEGVRTTKARFDIKFMFSNIDKENLSRVLICGPPSMNDTVPELLQRVGIPDSKIMIV